MAQVNRTALFASVSANPHFMRFRKLPIGKELDVHDAMAVFSCFEEDRKKKSDVLYMAGSASERSVYMILEGSVSVSDPSGNVFSTLQAGDVFGLFSFLDDRPHSATLKAVGELTLLSLNRSYFDLITLEDPKMGYQLLQFMFRLLSRMSLKLEIEYSALRHYTQSLE
ncbi:MAG: cyclic nucleotide-binding domain-containing protein [Mariprofundaceae bacterium]